MGHIFSLLTAVLLMLCAVSAGAADTLPRVVFPPGYALPEGVVTVEGALTQVEVRQGQIVSAQRGDQFSMATAGLLSDAIHLNVLRGILTLVDVETNAITQLPPGSYVIAATGVSLKPGDGSSIPGGDTEALAPGYRLSDAVMTQQQKYLDSLKVDIRDINHVLASIIRGLVPRRP
jgi:hypothetical protein